MKNEPDSDTAIPAPTNSALLDRALGSFLGLAVGDALGATVEFMTASEIAEQYKVHNQIIGGGWLHLKPGRVTDDTEMALALGSAIIANDGWNPRAVADSFVAWLRSKPIDVGSTCRRGICRYMENGSIVALPSPQDGGNGAAMRNLPTVLATLHDEELMIQRSLEQARITHNQPQSDAATVALARMTRRLVLEGSHAPCDQIVAELIARHPEFRFRPWPGRASGYIVDTVQTVLDSFFHSDNFEDCLVRVVNRGGDADTTGAIAGQLAGALHGLSAVPSRWLNRLDSNIVTAICEQVPKLLKLSLPP